MDDLERPEREDDEIDLLDYLFVILKRKRFIAAVTAGITVLAVIISLLIPKTYKAESRILPPTQQSQGLSAQLLGQLGGVVGAGMLGAAAGVRTTGDLYVGLLKSRPVLDAIVDRFKLMELHKTKYREDARRGLLGQLKATDDKKSGIITITVEDKDPKRAADMTNAFVDELKNLNKHLAVTEAGQRRLFYEEQLKDVKESLLGAEESLKGFQEKTGAIKMDDQARAMIQSLAQVRAQIAAKEVQLKVMKTYATANNPDAQRLDEEIRGLKEQMGRLEAKGGGHADALMPTSRMPQVGTDYLRKMRELKFNEALYEILLKQFEAAKLDEARDAALIQVIEQAVPPERKFKPKRALMVMIAFVAGLLISTFGAFFLEFVERSRQDPERRKRLEQLRAAAFILRK
jgi:uncharacterized protein involved in exopolysaccharide biosynthesis